MKYLIIGSGGREHALCSKLNNSPSVQQIWCWPGSPATQTEAESVDLSPDASHHQLCQWALDNQIDAIVVGPEQPLAQGLADTCAQNGLPCFGPRAAAANLEASKNFAKEVMHSAGIPTAAYHLATDLHQVEQIAQSMLEAKGATVIKASGLAAGKGVFVCNSAADIKNAIERLDSRAMREAAKEVVIEECLVGRECSFFVCLGQGKPQPLGFAVDFKRLQDGDLGPNTGGMGCYTPVPWLPADAEHQVMEQVVKPLTTELAKRSMDYTGFLYVGLMWGSSGPQVVEFNVRLGDPEAQVLAVHDKRDWGLIIAQQLGLTSGHDQGGLDPKRRSVCVVLASASYPYGDAEDSHLSLERQQLGTSSSGESALFGASLQQGSSGSNGLATGRGRCLNVVASGASFNEARQRVYENVGELAKGFPGVQFRRDIAELASTEEAAQ